MSGHSKWANIKHKKGRQDAIKGKIYTKMGKLIAVAAKEGGADPNSNSRLKEAITKAKAANMPNDNIERAIKKGVGDLGNNTYENITYEGYGINGVAVIVEALTDNKNRTAGDVRYIFDKNGGNLGTSGCVSFLFEKKGKIYLDLDIPLSEEELMELALDAGAEDFETSEDGYEITTDPESFNSVSQMIEFHDLKPISASIEMVPSTETELIEEDHIKNFRKMLDMFDDNDDVQEIYHNGILPDEE